MELTNKEKQELPEQDILRQERVEQIKKEKVFKTRFMKDLETEEKEQNKILNDYYG